MKNIRFLFLSLIIIFSFSLFGQMKDIPEENFSKEKVELPEGISSGWFDTAINNISKEEYNITYQNKTKRLNGDSAYQAPNRAQGFRTYFTEQGIKVVSRDEEKQSFELGLSLRATEKNEILIKNKKVPSIYVEKNRIEIDRGWIKEWYVNSNEGLRQGFEIAGTIREDIPLELELQVTGNLRSVLSGDGQSVEFYSDKGFNVLHYGSLAVKDALENELKAKYETTKGGIKIKVDNSNAVYPITIESLTTTPAWTSESNQGNAYFGYSVSTAGDVNGDGYSDVIIGAYAYDNGQSDEGRAFVYYGSAGGLSTSPDWISESNQVGASFGRSVSTAGDVNGDGYSDVIIGAYAYDNGESYEGRVFVYYGSAGGLSTSPNWTAESDQAYAFFGNSVSTAGDVNGDGYSDVIVGAYYYDNGETDEGRAFAYYGSSSGLSLTPDWISEANQAGANFGISVSTAGDVNGDGYSDVIVGAYLYDNGETDEGRTFVYYGSSGGLSASPDWTVESNQTSANFGISVSAAGDVNGDGYSDVIIGAYYYDSGETNEGMAFVYYGSAGGLSTLPDWTSESNRADAAFGISVSTAGDVNGDGYSDVIIGAYLYDNGEAAEGWAFVYYGSSSGLSLTPDWTSDSNQVYAYFGISVSTAGDVNGNGYSDVIIGAYYYDSGETNEGMAFVYYGSAQGLSTSPNWTSESNQVDAYFGFSVSTAGDVNGDGYSDVIIGAYYYDSGETNEGMAFVYYGSAQGLSTSPNWTAESNQADAYFGFSVSTAGDVNGDGYSDVIISAPYYDNVEGNEGRAFLYYGSSSGLSLTLNWVAESNQSGAYFGYSVSTTGDVNGDGYSDVVIGAPYYDNVEGEEGRAFVYYGSAGGLSTSPDWISESNQQYASYGNSVSTAGDVNGDGYSDVIIGALYYDNGETDEGRAFVYYGSAQGLSISPNWTAESDQTNAYFGRSVSTAGDVNGDGYSDVIVGAYYYDNVEGNEGRAFAYYGSSSGLSLTPDWTSEANQASANFGISVSTAGDVNGDGYSDVIVGAYLYDNGQSNEGRAFVFYGNEGRGVPVALKQLRSDLSVPVVPALLSYSHNSFGVSVKLRSSYGRVLVRGEVEVKQIGIPFDGTGLITTDWIDLWTTGYQIQNIIGGLTNNTVYKWRMRVKYHPKYGSPIHTKWFYIQYNGLTECDFRTGFEDSDGDGYKDDVDCSPYNNQVWATPSDVINFYINQETTNNLTWSAPIEPGCVQPVYDVLRSVSASDFSSAYCVISNTTSLSATDNEAPSPILFYLVRVENSCGSNMGTDSNNNPRSGVSCP